jgi:hypothetical protein
LKLLLLDIETAPNLVHVWGLYQQNVGTNQIIASGYVLCVAAKWYGDDEIQFFRGPGMLRKVHALLDEAHAVITYNGQSFDLPTLNKEFIVAGINPPSPYKSVDLYRVARSTFRFPSRKLDYIAQALKIGEKVKHEGHELWIKCMADVPEAWERMEEYNRHDVTLLESVYVRMLPWIRLHPNAGLYDEAGLPVCPNCGSGKLRRKGWAYTTTNKYARLVCLGCGKWSRDTNRELPKEDTQNITRPIA